MPDFFNMNQHSQRSKMNQSMTAGMSTGENIMTNTAKSSFRGQAGDKYSIKIKNHLVDPKTKIGNKSLSTPGDPQWPSCSKGDKAAEG